MMAYQAENSAATFSDNRLARESSSSAATQPEQAPPTTWQVKITSGRAVLGQGTIRQITYFPIKVHLICGPTPPDATPWYDNTLVYRRYSELVLLRRYLLLKYTQEFVPPLPAKSTSQSFSTAMCNNETLTLQQRHAMFFVDRLSENPNLYLYDRYVAPFLQLPRDDNDPVTGGEPERVVTPSNSARSFASLTLVKAALEQEVATFERQLDQTDPNVFASGSAAVVGGWVRSTASYVSGWFGRGKNDPLSVSEDEVQRLLASEREYLRWSEIRSALIKEQQNLVDVVKSAAAVTISSKEMEQADNELQSALVSFADCLTQTSDQDLKQLVSRACELNPTRAMIAKSTFSVAAHAENMIYNETLLLESIIETVNLLLNRYRSFAHRRLNKLSPMSPSMVHQESVDLFNIGARLGERLKVWRRTLADRFVWLNSARSKRMSQQTLGPASDIIGQSEIWQLLNSQTFMSVDALSR